jgi:hypothetical protein
MELLETKCKKCKFKLYAMTKKDLQKESDRHEKIFHGKE